MIIRLRGPCWLCVCRSSHQCQGHRDFVRPDCERRIPSLVGEEPRARGRAARGGRARGGRRPVPSAVPVCCSGSRSRRAPRQLRSYWPRLPRVLFLQNCTNNVALCMSGLGRAVVCVCGRALRPYVSYRHGILTASRALRGRSPTRALVAEHFAFTSPAAAQRGAEAGSSPQRVFRVDFFQNAREHLLHALRQLFFVFTRLARLGRVGR